MEICEEGHEEVCYEGHICPVCDILADWKWEVEELNREIDKLQGGK